MQVASCNRGRRLDITISVRICREDDDWIQSRGYDQADFVREAIRDKIEYIKNHEVDELKAEIERREDELEALKNRLAELEDEKRHQQFVKAKETVTAAIKNWRPTQHLEDLHKTIEQLYPDLTGEQRKEIHQLTESLWGEHQIKK